jgi:hypothetical protein
MKALLTLAIIGTAILLSGASADAAETFTIKQDKPKLTDVDVGGKGASHGGGSWLALNFSSGWPNVAGQPTCAGVL